MHSSPFTYLPVSSVTVKFCGGVPIPTDTKYCDPWSLYNGVLKGSLLSNCCCTKGAADLRIKGRRNNGGGGSTSLWIAAVAVVAAIKPNESMEGIIIIVCMYTRNNKEKDERKYLLKQAHTCKQDIKS